MSTWHYSRNGQSAGPISSAELKQLAATGQLEPVDLIWKEGMAEWQPASKIKGLFAATPAAPSAATAAPSQSAAAPITEIASASAIHSAEASAIPYYSSISGIPDRAVKILKGYATSIGDRGDWPLNDQHLLQLKEAEKHRKKIRNATGLYKGLFALSLIALMIFLFSLLFAVGSSRSASGAAAPIMGMGIALAVVGAFTALYYFAYRATKKCQKWAPLTLFIVFILSIALEFASFFLTMSTSRGGMETIVVPLLGMILPIAFAVTSWQAFSAIPKFLATPMWCQEVLVNSAL